MNDINNDQMVEADVELAKPEAKPEDQVITFQTPDITGKEPEQATDPVVI